jgi:hypothetical protein
MKKVKLIYKDLDGYIKELIIEVSKDADIDQCLQNLYGWTIQEN